MFSTHNKTQDLRGGENKSKLWPSSNDEQQYQGYEYDSSNFRISPVDEVRENEDRVADFSKSRVDDLESSRRDNQLVNINISGVKMNSQVQQNELMVDMSILETDLWYTGFGMSLRQMCDPREKIIIEGELYKYKPGIDTMYITRWCQLTKNSLRVYKNQMSAKGFSNKPLIALPLNIFKSIKKSKFFVPEKGKNWKLVKILNKNQFELWYKPEVLNLIMMNFLQSKIINDEDSEENVLDDDHLDLSDKLSILKGNLTANETFKIKATMETLNNSCTWSNREGEWFWAEKRLLFSSQRSKDKEQWTKAFKKYIP